jgi:hypothetical protein
VICELIRKHASVLRAALQRELKAQRWVMHQRGSDEPEWVAAKRAADAINDMLKALEAA